MVEIAHLRKFVAAEQTTTSSTFSSTTCTIAGSSFVGTGKYLIIASASFGPDSSNQLGEMRLVHGSTVFKGSLYKDEPHHSATEDKFKSYGHFAIFDQPATPETITIEFASTDNATQVRANTLALSAIRLDVDLVENTDWWHAVDDDIASPVPMSSRAFASKTLTTVTNDDYLFLSQIQISGTDGATRMTVRNRVDTTLYTTSTQEGEDVTEVPEFFHIAFFNESSGQSRDFDIWGAGADHNYSQVFILKLNDVFASYAGFHNIGDVALSTAYTELAGVAPVLATTQDMLLLAWASVDGTFGKNTRARIQEGGVDKVTAGTHYQNQQHDAVDEGLLFLTDIQNITSGTKDFDFDAQAISTGGDWQYRNFVVIGLELAGAGSLVIPRKPLQAMIGR